MKNKIENTNRRYDPISLVEGQNAAAPTTLRWKTAGKSNVSGTLVKAPISATRSSKKGIALATKNALHRAFLKLKK